MYGKENDAHKENQMARKYYQDKKDRMDESRGMKKYKREDRDHRDFVTGHDPMVGRNDFANMPPKAVNAAYPKSHVGKGGYLDDTMSEIDAIQMDSERQIERHLSHQK
jgi:hypothetical protein